MTSPSLKVVIHAAAPVRRKSSGDDRMARPIVYEYLAGSEASGLTAVDTQAWLSHPGTVGPSRFWQGSHRGEDGDELPAGEVVRSFMRRSV